MERQRLQFMRHASVILLLLASCQSGDRAPLPRSANSGLRTKLIAVGKEFAVGAPLKFRLELTNESAFSFIYDSQGVDREGSHQIKDPDGKPVSYIDRPRQTAGDTILLRPGETVVL